jgi:hypothetical protein
MQDLLKRVRETKPRLVLLNAASEREYVLAILQEIHQSDASIYVIVSLPERFQHSVDSLMIAGAHDCVVKDENTYPITQNCQGCKKGIDSHSCWRSMHIFHALIRIKIMIKIYDHLYFFETFAFCFFTQ